MRLSLNAAALFALVLQIAACSQGSTPPLPPPNPSAALAHTSKPFTFHTSGDLASGGGSGLADNTIYLPGIRFPIENAPAFANSQVYSKGGKFGGGGTQCDPANYSYPWRDTFCESRVWTVQLCPTGIGHQGQDIRPATCAGGTHWAVAAEAGQITAITAYSVTLVSSSSPQKIYRYLHMKMNALAVTLDQHVARGKRLGLVNNDFPGGTTFHLHFDAQTSVTVNGAPVIMYVPPYASLVAAYKRLLSGKQ